MTRAAPEAEALAAGATELARRDDVMARLIELAGPCELRPPHDDAFGALLRAIVFQQLAGHAADAIHGRVVALLGGRPTPEGVLAATEDELRAAGLSGAKVAAVTDLARRSLDGTVPLDDLDRLGDDELVERLSAVRGIGRWTAEMFLVFQLRRLDVWPVGDLAVRRGYGRAYGLERAPTAAELTPLGERFRPYRTIAAWYLWQASGTLLPD